MKKKFRDDVSNYNILETENIQEDYISVVKSISSKFQTGKKKKFPKNFNNLIQEDTLSK